MSALNPSGWADDRLMEAFNLLDAVLSEAHEDHDAHALLKKARGLCEDADMALEQGA